MGEGIGPELLKTAVTLLRQPTTIVTIKLQCLELSEGEDLEGMTILSGRATRVHSARTNCEYMFLFIDLIIYFKQCLMVFCSYSILLDFVRSTKYGENLQHDNPVQTFITSPTVESDSAPTRKSTIGSSLSSASPPFYPSGSSNKEGGLSQKKDVQTRKSTRDNRIPSPDDDFSVVQSNSLLRGKNIANSIGMDKLRIDDLVTAFPGKPFSSMQASSYGSTSNSSQPSQARAQGKGGAPAAGQMAYPSTFPQGLVNKASPPLQSHTSQHSPVPNRVQPSAQQMGQHTNGSPASSPPKTTMSVNSYDTGESEPLPESSKSKGTLVAKGRGSIQGGGRGSFIYGGAHVMGGGGPMGVGHGDQNFAATPAFLPGKAYLVRH